MLNIISRKPRRGLIWLTSDKASAEGCGRRNVTITYPTPVPEGLNSQDADVQPLRGCCDGGHILDPVTAPLRGCFVTG